jgi:type IV pilus assembly protein PilV
MKHRSQGFSLIELLVAVLVMGIGVLGITALQMVSLQNNRGALLRADAVQLAYDAMDRMRANTGTVYGDLDVGDGPPAAADCTANNCSGAQMAAFDSAVWKCSLGAHNADNTCVDFRAGDVLAPLLVAPGLPSGDGSIAVDGATGVVTITVQWQDPNDPNVSTVTIASRT